MNTTAAPNAGPEPSQAFHARRGAWPVSGRPNLTVDRLARGRRPPGPKRRNSPDIDPLRNDVDHGSTAMGSSRRRSDCRSACGTPGGPTQPTTTCESTAAFNLHDPGQLGPGRTPAWACSSLRWPGLRLRSTFTDVAVPGPRGWSSGHAATSRARTGRSRGRRKGTILRGQPAHGWPEPWHDGPTATFLVALFAAPALVMSSFGFWGRPRLGEDCGSLAAVAEGDTNGTCRSS